MINSITVVGGGTAGLISAIMLRQRFDFQINLIYSKNIGIIGVGEGSTEHFKHFLEFTGIDYKTLIKECDATFKGGIKFEGWSDKSFLHLVNPPYNYTLKQYHYIYARQILENQNYYSQLTAENLLSDYWIDNPSELPYNQFHFDTYKLNDYLMKVAEKKNINIYDDEIIDVSITEVGNIDSIVGKKQKYKSDFYIDSTGFKRILIGKLDCKWKSFSKYLKMKKAVTFQSNDVNSLNLWTLAKAMNYGWMFRIPTYNHYGNGYIYDSDFCTDEQAKIELDNYFGKNVDIGKSFSFDPGYLENVWINNCCAVGLSSSFVEPLEATSIGTTIQQMFMLVDKIHGYNPMVIKKYNKGFKDILENIRDFIFLHYLRPNQNNHFWTTISDLEMPDSLKENFEIWKHKLPIYDDFSGLTEYILFKSSNFIVLMNGLGLFDKSSIEREFRSIHQGFQKNACLIVDDYHRHESIVKTISHKDMLEIIRNRY
jgi:tryptophan halogenase